MQTRGPALNIDYINAKKPTISGQGATRTLNENESGSQVLFDRAAGIIYTLPTAKPGIFFDFFVSTTITSNNAKVITSAGTEFILGGVNSIDTDSSNVEVGFLANGTTHVAITQNGTTTGGIRGTSFRLTCVSTTLWKIEGDILGSGVVATPFATS